jgi:hypothetical protein
MPPQSMCSGAYGLVHAPGPFYKGFSHVLVQFWCGFGAQDLALRRHWKLHIAWCGLVHRFQVVQFALSLGC